RLQVTDPPMVSNIRVTRPRLLLQVKIPSTMTTQAGRTHHPARMIPGLTWLTTVGPGCTRRMGSHEQWRKSHERAAVQDRPADHQRGDDRGRHADRFDRPGRGRRPPAVGYPSVDQRDGSAP